MGEPGFSDSLLSATAAATVAFDRFYFNLHGPEPEPFLVLGGGVYPPARIVDGYMVCATDGVQRNLRLSAHQSARSDGVQALHWEVEQPLGRWRLRLEANPSDVEFDLTWIARGPAYETHRYEVADEQGASDHAHFFQAGRYEGELSIDGNRTDVSGWLGERDRSRGHRRVSDRLGIHLWVQAQFEREAIGVLFNSDRSGKTAFCDGAVMGHDGALRPIVGLRHALVFTDSLRCTAGQLDLILQDGSTRLLIVAPRGRPLYLAGSGHAGWHGLDHGDSRVEHERWGDDPARNPRAQPITLTQTEAGYEQGGQSGTGVFEYAHTRSSAFIYDPTLRS